MCVCSAYSLRDSNCSNFTRDGSGKQMFLYKGKSYAKQCGLGLEKWRLIATTGLVEHTEWKLENYSNIKEGIRLED